MAETESEKILKDSIRYRQECGDIRWGTKLWQAVHGSFSVKAPIDFKILKNDGSVHYVEVKEVGRVTLPYSNFKEKQKELLNLRMSGVKNDFWLVIRMFSGDYNRNNSHYFEHYFWCPGYIAPEEGDRGSISFHDLMDDDECIRFAYHEHGKSHGFSESFGVTSRGNNSRGFKHIPILEEENDD